MLELLLVIAVYTAVVLILVPLEKIAKWQTSVRAQWQKLLDKIKS